MSGDWATVLSEIPNQSGLQEWRVAAVTATDAEAAAIGFPDGTRGRIPLSELTWAREQIQTWLGSEIRRPSDAVSPGDVVYVEALSGEDTAGQYGLRQVPERSPETQ